MRRTLCAPRRSSRAKRRSRSCLPGQERTDRVCLRRRSNRKWCPRRAPDRGRAEGFNINRRWSGNARAREMGEGEVRWIGPCRAVAFGRGPRGTRVRLAAGFGRGTFSQRHAVMYDTQTDSLDSAFRAQSQENQHAVFEVFDVVVGAGGARLRAGYSVIARTRSCCGSAIRRFRQRGAGNH